MNPKTVVRIGLVLSLTLLIAAAAAFVQQSPTQHFKFTVGCSGYPICVFVINPTTPGFSLGTASAFVSNMNYTLNIVSSSSASFTSLYLNTTIFSAPPGVSFRLNNLNATLPTTFSSGTQWRNGPFNLGANGSTRALFQLFLNSTGVPIGSVGQYDIGFTVIQ